MNKVLVTAAAVAALAVAAPAVAQQTTTPATPVPAATAPAATKAAIPSGVFVRGQRDGQTLARDRLIGLPVLNAQGQVIGDIEDLIMINGTQVVGVIMGVGGFLGAGEKKVGVQYSALKFDTKDGKTTISLPQATKEVLAALDPYQRLEPRKSLIERAKEKAKELTDKAKETVGDAAKKAQETAAAAAKKAQEAASAAAQKAKEAAQPTTPPATPGQPATKSP